MKKIIAVGTYWKCENMDMLAPIIEEGYQYLLSDGSKVNVEYGKENEELNGLEYATQEEKESYTRTHYGIIFIGDMVTIKRGRKMVGETKKVVRGFRFDIDGAYGNRYVYYVVFEDGTKVNINHCDTVGTEYNNNDYRELADRRKVDNLFVVGGRVY